ncbi:hypothetical protein ACJRO7_010893 [Eucalyptus globulus]|uniref:Uncharacterized protein n=1 Tax=Eucalyptus globulus TaxID=34317 RepID=A0ABD3LDE6_EUCGL
MPLGALMTDNCACKGFPCEATRFDYDSGQVSEAKSVKDLGMDDENVIYIRDNKFGG